MLYLFNLLHNSFVHVHVVGPRRSALATTHGRTVCTEFENTFQCCRLILNCRANQTQ